MTSSLSVIIPTFNRADYVRSCLVALRESNVPDLEVIVADDGSTDDTSAVVAATNPSAIYLWQPNSGTPSTVRNLGFQHSHGRYVAFLDCDDEWLPNIPAEAVRILDRHPEIEVLFADAQMGNPTEGYRSFMEICAGPVFPTLPHREVEPAVRILDREPFFLQIIQRNAIFLGLCIVRREAFAATGGFDPNLRGAADWDVLMRLAAKQTCAYWNVSFSRYTRHLNNMSDDHEGMTREFCLALESVLRKLDLPAEHRFQVRACLQRQRFHYAYYAYDSGNWPAARRRFTQAVQAGNRRPLTLALWVATHLPKLLVLVARSTLQRLRGTHSSPGSR